MDKIDDLSVGGYRKGYGWLCEALRQHLAQLEEQRAKNAKKPPTKDAGKGAPAKTEKPAAVEETPATAADEGAELTLQDLYKKLLSAQRPESGQKGAKGQKPAPKTLQAVTEFKGRHFREDKSGRGILCTVTGTDRPRMTLQETLVDIAMLAIKLQALPDHQVFNQLVDPQRRAELPVAERTRLERWEAETVQAEIDSIRRALEAQQEQAAALAASGAAKDRKGAKTPQQPPKGKGAAPVEEVDELLEKAKAIQTRFMAPRPLRQLNELIDMEAVLIQQRYVKELKKLVWLKEHQWLGPGPSANGTETMESTNMDFLLLNTETQEKEAEEPKDKPRNSLHQLFSSSQILNLPFETDTLHQDPALKEEKELLNAFKKSGEVP